MRYVVKKLSFKKGTVARKARGKVAEDLKSRGVESDSAFAQVTAITKRASTGGQKRLSQHGLKKKKG